MVLGAKGPLTFKGPYLKQGFTLKIANFPQQRNLKQDRVISPEEA